MLNLVSFDTPDGPLVLNPAAIVSILAVRSTDPNAGGRADVVRITLQNGFCCFVEGGIAHVLERIRVAELPHATLGEFQRQEAMAALVANKAELAELELARLKGPKPAALRIRLETGRFAAAVTRARQAIAAIRSERH